MAAPLLIAVTAAVAPVIGFSPDAAAAYVAPVAGGQGYWLVASDGGIFSFGDAAFFGSMGGQILNKPIVGMAPTPDSHGYWEVASDGGIFSFGDAAFYGSTGAIRLNQPIVGMAPTPDGQGYWLVASDGGIFSFGDAGYHGSTGAIRLNQPIVGMASTPDGQGYWLVAADGGIFSFGDAAFYGALSTSQLAGSRAVGIAASPDGGGYTIGTAAGKIYTFGDAAGDLSLTGQTAPLVAIGGSPDFAGIRAVQANGNVMAAGDPEVFGGLVGYTLNHPIVGMANVTDGIPDYIHYGSDPQQVALVYPSALANSPLVIEVHGGGFTGGSASDIGVATEAAYLQAQGVTVVSIDYRLSTSTSGAFPMEVDDVESATAWAKSHAGAFNANPANLTLLGGSAGGTLVALAAGAVHAVNVIDVSGINELSAEVQGVVQQTIAGAGFLVTGLEDALSCPDLATCVASALTTDSPVNNIDLTAHYLVANSVDDPLVPPSQAQDFATGLETADVSVQLLIEPGSAHAFELMPQINPQILALITS